MVFSLVASPLVKIQLLVFIRWNKNRSYTEKIKYPLFILLKSHTDDDNIYVSINPLVTNGLSHPNHLDESTFSLRGIRSDFSFLFHFSMKIMSANRKAPDGTPRLAASHLGLYCLPMSDKKDARLIWVNITRQIII